MPVARTGLRPETIHPSLWRASQLARGQVPGVDTGHPDLSAQLPGGGWPPGSLTEILLPQPGIGELRLLQPVLRRPMARGTVVLVQPPHMLQPLALSWWGVDPACVICVRATRQADALWAAEQALLAGTCQLVLLWPPTAGARSTGRAKGVSDAGQHRQLRPDALRRLHLAAQAGSTLFFLFRPLRDAVQPSPAPLRLGLAPARDGVQIRFIKRRGPVAAAPLFVPLWPSPALLDASPVPGVSSPASPAVASQWRESQPRIKPHALYGKQHRRASSYVYQNN